MNKNLSKTMNIGKFNNVFTEVIHSEQLGLKNPEELRLFHLDVQNTAFSYSDLESFIRKNIGQYVFSRATIEQYKIDGDEFSVALDATRIIKNKGSSNQNLTGNELGEILLYTFLEQVLSAPKIMSKVELSSKNSKSDAIHLLPLTMNNKPFYHMVFGTSSVVGDIEDAIDNAFTSIMNIHNQSKDERILAENTILNKSFDQETTTYIKDLLIPSEGSKVPCDSAYGVFIGYNLGLDPQKYSNIDFPTVMEQKMNADIINHADYIKQQIDKNKLNNYSFYFYIVPFNDADADKITIINNIMN